MEKYQRKCCGCGFSAQVEKPWDSPFSLLPSRSSIVMALRFPSSVGMGPAKLHAKHADNESNGRQKSSCVRLTWVSTCRKQSPDCMTTHLGSEDPSSFRDELHKKSSEAIEAWTNPQNIVSWTNPPNLRPDLQYSTPSYDFKIRESATFLTMNTWIRGWLLGHRLRPITA